MPILLKPFPRTHTSSRLIRIEKITSLSGRVPFLYPGGNLVALLAEPELLLV